MGYLFCIWEYEFVKLSPCLAYKSQKTAYLRDVTESNRLVTVRSLRVTEQMIYNMIANKTAAQRKNNREVVIAPPVNY